MSCNDMDACTVNDRDGAGECAGTPEAGAGCACVTYADCNEDIPCNQDTCSNATCSNLIQSGS